MNDDTRPNDLLLLAGKAIALVMQGLMILGAGVLAIAIPALLVFRAEVIAEMADQATTLAFPLFQLTGIMAIGLAVVVMLFFFFGKLRQIIATVGEGDPFDPVNAKRLSLMGWLMLGIQLLAIPATALGTSLMEYADEVENANLSIDAGMDLTGILLAIILFILSRVFRHGAAMRDDLEGTV